MKKFISSVVLIIIVISSFCPAVSAEKTPAIMLESKIVSSSDSIVTLDLIAENLPLFNTLIVRVVFERTELELVDVENCSTSNLAFVALPQEIYVDFAWISVEDVDYSLDGVITAISFRLPDNTYVGQSFSVVTYAALKNKDSAGYIELSPTPFASVITIDSLIKGDVNADGSVTTEDAAFVLWAITGRRPNPSGTDLSHNQLWAARVSSGSEYLGPSAEDALLILKKALGLINSFPCGE